MQSGHLQCCGESPHHPNAEQHGNFDLRSHSTGLKSGNCGANFPHFWSGRKRRKVLLPSFQPIICFWFSDSALNFNSQTAFGFLKQASVGSGSFSRQALGRILEPIYKFIVIPHLQHILCVLTLRLSSFLDHFASKFESHSASTVSVPSFKTNLS